LREIRTAKQLETAWNELREEILSRPLFLDNSPKAKAERKKRGEKSIEEFARIYFPEYVKKESAKFHKEWEKIRQIENEPIIVKSIQRKREIHIFHVTRSYSRDRLWQAELYDLLVIQRG